jgi:transketolase
VRNAFADEVTQLAKVDSRVMVLSGDIGNKLFDPFKKLDQKRFINCGIAESNMMSLASGLALNGLRPIIYTITPFTTTRCFEQIRVDVCYHNSPVIIVGTGSGLSYAELGPTHHSLEDLAIMRTLPGMQVIAPCDSIELRLALRTALLSSAPTYIRIGKKGEPIIHDVHPTFSIGKAITMRTGSDILILSTGTLMSNALKAANMLGDIGLSSQIASFHTIKPFDNDYLHKHLEPYRLIVTIEEHSKIGGLGSIVSESLASKNLRPPQLMIGVEDEFMHETGSQEYAQRKYNLHPEGIYNQIQLALKN